jgi:hypothetical protein
MQEGDHSGCGQARVVSAKQTDGPALFGRERENFPMRWDTCNAVTCALRCAILNWFQ